MNLNETIIQIPDCELIINADLTKYTTMRLSSHGDLVEVRSISALQKILPLLSIHQREYLVVGWGANQILPNQCDKLIIHLNFPFEMSYFEQLRNEYILPASLGINHLTSHAVKFGIKGWEVFTGIPASLGGAVFMNAGTNLGEIGPLVKNVKVVTKDGELRDIKIDGSSFSYRKNHFLNEGDILVEITMGHQGQDPSISQKIKDYLDYRKQTQPLTTKNCGCVFKNPSQVLQAGRLIDRLGLKGLTIGGLRISSKHANFIENFNEANWDQFQSLVGIIQFQMNHFYGIEFELEVKIPYH